MPMSNSSRSKKGYQAHFSFVTCRVDVIVDRHFLLTLLRKRYRLNAREVLFKTYGINKDLGGQWGYGFIFFNDLEQTQSAIRNLGGLRIDGIAFDCSMSAESEEKIQSSLPPPTAGTSPEEEQAGGSSAGPNISDDVSCLTDASADELATEPNLYAMPIPPYGGDMYYGGAPIILPPWLPNYYHGDGMVYVSPPPFPPVPYPVIYPPSWEAQQQPQLGYQPYQTPMNPYYGQVGAPSYQHPPMPYWRLA
eukprot:gene2819-3073_t